MTDWYLDSSGNRTWLLGDGTVLEEPAMEVSASRRRSRIYGRQDTSAPYGQRDDVLMNEVRRLAKRRKTYPWMPLAHADAKMHYQGCKPENGNTALFLVNDKNNMGNTSERTQVYWTFRHPTLPIEAQVVVAGETAHSTRHTVTTKLSVPDTRSDRFAAKYWGEMSGTFRSMRKAIGDTTGEILDEALEKPPTYLGDGENGRWGSHGFASERQAAKWMLDTLRWAESLETIQIPDLRSDEGGAWLELELVETNMDAQLTTDLIEYLTAGPTIDKALDAYNEFQSILRSLGVVLPKVSENQIQRMLLAGDDKSLRLSVSTVSDLDGATDPHHSLHVHLTSGTFAVKCSVNHADGGEIADSWAEAQAIASISGRETELLAYAREFARTNDDTKARRLVSRRRAGLINGI